MLLNITTTHYPATDLGYLLHKHPDKFQTFPLTVGKAHVFYPEKSDERTTVSLLLDIDTIDMVRGSKNLSGDAFALGHYINDRPYVASSFMGVAISNVFSSALNGHCKDKPNLPTVPLPLEVKLSVVAVPKGGEILLHRFFEPLGYEMILERHDLDPMFPEWGKSKYFTVQLKHTITIQQLLSHLYVLLPALDNDKHYFVSTNEIEILLKKGEGWLKDHPERKQIIERFLVHQASYVKQVMEQLEDTTELTETIDADETEAKAKREQRESLHSKRLKAVVEQLVASGATSVVDLGCGEGKLIKQLLAKKQFTKIVGMDVAYDELLTAKQRLRYDDMPQNQQDRLQLIQGSLMYRDYRLENFDAAAVVEVIEHLELNRLRAFERVLFEHIRAKTIVLTTPNREFNVMWESMNPDQMRHADHRFEWTRQEFADWANGICAKYQYNVEILPLGDEVEPVGAPSQMAVFTYGN
jgi:3' terminal RNA ribose 2'-O-methyltransferase Hen1